MEQAAFNVTHSKELRWETKYVIQMNAHWVTNELMRVVDVNTVQEEPFQVQQEETVNQSPKIQASSVLVWEKSFHLMEPHAIGVSHLQELKKEIQFVLQTSV